MQHLYLYVIEASELSSLVRVEHLFNCFLLTSKVKDFVSKNQWNKHGMVVTIVCL